MESFYGRLMSVDLICRLDRTPSSKCLHVFTDQKGWALHLDFHPGGNCIGVGTSDKKVKVFDVRMRKLQQLYSSHDDVVTQVRSIANNGEGVRTMNTELT